ncbi:hypothetical protein ACJMK2_028788, partial [Sinanodonta woodiana]
EDGTDEQLFALNIGKGEIDKVDEDNDEVDGKAIDNKVTKIKSVIVKLPAQTTKADKAASKTANLQEKNKTLRRQLNESINNNSTITDTINQLQQQNSIIQQELIDLREQLKDVNHNHNQLKKTLNEVREKLSVEQKNHSALMIKYNNLLVDYKAALAKQDTINQNPSVTS